MFNTLTGLNQKVGNFPGVTVDKKTGRLDLKGNAFKLIDLPGTYSLDAISKDEKITQDYIQQSNNNIVIVVADATNLKRNLLLCSQIIDTGSPVILALNMMDLLQRSNKEIDISKLSSLLNIPVIPINARLNKGIDELKLAIDNYHFKEASFIKRSPLVNTIDETLLRYKKINQVVNQCIVVKGEDKLSLLTKKIDNVLTHKFYGYLIFITILFIIFQAIFSWSAYPMKAIEMGFLWLEIHVSTILPQGILNDLIVNGILAGLGGIIVFVPQIAVLFGFITILEDTGYLSRVSFLMDRILRQFGLNGKSIIPLLSSTACAVPAIMSTRTINNFKERLITIMVAPLISCSARIPVYTLLISLIVPKSESVGVFNLQGIIMMGLYLIGFIAALVVAWVMKLLLKNKQRSNFILEMPIYRLPRWKNVFMEMLNKVKIFLFNAGKIIIAISIILWVLSSYGPGNTFKRIEKKYTQTSIKKQYSEQEIQNNIAAEKLEASYAGHIGKAIEPVIKPLGFDWKIGISLITSFAAREVFVGTMSTLYSVGEGNNTKSLSEKLISAKDPKTGKKLYTLATTLSLLIFYAFAMQCMTTLAVVYKETGSIKWPLIQLIYLGFLAYSSSYLVFNLFS